MTDLPGSWAQAKACASQFYFTGRECRNGHLEKRFTTNGTCVACGREQRRRSHSANLEQENGRQRAARRADPERLRARDRDWRRANPDLALAAFHRKRARRLGIVNTLTAAEITELREASGGRCAECAERAKLTLDHIAPVSRGGENSRHNVQFLCMPCNQRKGVKIATAA